MTDLYDTLGVDKDADAVTIKRAYRRKANQWHPDKPGGDRDRFEAVARANIILSDPAKRAKYDATGDTENAPDNRVGLVIAALVEAFQGAIGAAMNTMSGLAMTDIIAATKRSLEGNIAGGKQANDQMGATIAQTEKVLKRLRFKGAGNDPLTVVLKANVASAKANIAQNDEKIAILRDAIKLADDYDYEVDKPAPYAPPFSSMSFTSTNTDEELRRIMDGFDW